MTHFNVTNDNDNYYGYFAFEESLNLENVDINDLEMDQMPGFNFSWWYTGGNVEPGNIYNDSDQYYDHDPTNIHDTYREFVREALK